MQTSNSNLIERYSVKSRPGYTFSIGYVKEFRKSRLQINAGYAKGGVWVASGDVNGDGKSDNTNVDLDYMMDAASNDFDMLKQLTDLYTTHTTGRLQELKIAIRKKEAADVYAVAHKCLGSSSTLGMRAIVPSLRELERIGRGGELEGADDQLEIAQTEFERIKVFLETYIMQSSP